MVLERFVIVGVGAEFLLSEIVERVSNSNSALTGRQLQPGDAVFGKLSSGHVTLGRDGCHGRGYEALRDHIVFGPSVRIHPLPVFQLGEGLLSIVIGHFPSLCQEFGFEYLVGNGGNRQTGEGIHMDRLQHEVPIFQTGILQEIHVAVTIGHQFCLKVEGLVLNGGMPGQELVALRWRHLVCAVERGIQVGPHVIPIAGHVGQMGKVPLATGL